MIAGPSRLGGVRRARFSFSNPSARNPPEASVSHRDSEIGPPMDSRGTKTRSHGRGRRGRRLEFTFGKFIFKNVSRGPAAVLLSANGLRASTIEVEARRPEVDLADLSCEISSDIRNNISEELLHTSLLNSEMT